MTIEVAIKTLEYHQRWRRGEDLQMLDTKVVGSAIDVAINEMKKRLIQE